MEPGSRLVEDQLLDDILAWVEDPIRQKHAEIGLTAAADRAGVFHLDAFREPLGKDEQVSVHDSRNVGRSTDVLNRVRIHFPLAANIAPCQPNSQLIGYIQELKTFIAPCQRIVVVGCLSANNKTVLCPQCSQIWTVLGVGKVAFIQ